VRVPGGIGDGVCNDCPFVAFLVRRSRRRLDASQDDDFGGAYALVVGPKRVCHLRAPSNDLFRGVSSRQGVDAMLEVAQNECRRRVESCRQF